MRKRIKCFISQVVKDHPEGHVLVVTHGGVIRNLVGELQGKETHDIKVNNTALLQLAIKGDNYEIISLDGIE